MDAAAGAVASRIFGRNQDKRQIKQQEKLTEIQEGANKRLMQQGYENQMNMFDYTSDKNSIQNQIKDIKAAGLNPALMYGGLEGGGGMTGAGGGGSVSGGDASGAAESEMANIQKQGMLMGISKLRSEIKLNEAQAEKNEAEAEKTSGIDTEESKNRIEKLIAETSNERTKEILTKVETSLKKIEEFETIQSQDDRLGAIKYNAEMAAEQLEAAIRENQIGEETVKDVINTIKSTAIGATLANELSKAQRMGILSGIEMNKAQMQQIAENIMQGWENIWNDKDKIKQGAEKLKLEERDIVTKELKAQYPTLNQVGGKMLDRVAGALYDTGADIDEIVGRGHGRRWNNK